MPSPIELLTNQEMAEADRLTILAGVPGEVLMENAGRACVEAILERWSKRRVLILTGPGNNGGDGFVIARLLQQLGWPVVVAALGDVNILRGDAAIMAKRWDGPVVALDPAILDDAELVVDALFGAGLTRAIEGMALEVLEAVAESHLPVVAVDVPSGLDGNSGEIRGFSAPAQLTVTFFRKKPGHLLMPGRTLVGELVLADIGINGSVLREIKPRQFLNGPDLWGRYFPWPQNNDHKYQRGHVLVSGGGLESLGAAKLSARAALRVGAGLVTVAAPRETLPALAMSQLSVMQRVCDRATDYQELLKDPRKNALLIGPGHGLNDRTRDFVHLALRSRRPTVLDADALGVFANESQHLFDAIEGPVVMTPHEGEFARLFDDFGGDKLARARAAADVSGAVIVLKGADSVIAAPDWRAAINDNAPPFLATAGSGDVLAGLIAGLLAQGMDAFDAACAGVWLHGAAATAFGPGLIAEDLTEILPQILSTLKSRIYQGSK